MGRTIKKDIKTDRFRDDTHIKHSIINETTGIACIVAIKGWIKTLNVLDPDPSRAMPIPSTKASKKPRLILQNEYHTVFQKSTSKES